ncbi:radical SAM protein [Myxococcota bacterium]|nr:radical SAM protein [Myxococcota bacterium]MBU1535062.1 radical SAM protein [Myxococcota bacterium]
MVTVERKRKNTRPARKILLTGVYGPFGVTCDAAEGNGMQMELLNNQITRQQGIHSPRQFYYTLALYFLAENISIPSTVLDFPTWKAFCKELATGAYTHVGINFIVPNVGKAGRMAQYIRMHHPGIQIIVGGYGAAIPELQRLVPHDAVCKGEGISWLRRYFGDDPEAPVRHPILQNPIEQRLYGYKSVPRSSVLVPGLGCTNGCEFCVTSHHYEKQYVPLLKTGREIFEVCKEAYETRKASGFTIMDENFLKEPTRARELLALMEEAGTPFVFEIFSSAEVVREVGVDFLVRLGVKMVWIGVESRAWTHAKVAGLDLKGMIRELQKNGISVNSSAILFLDHHTPEELAADVEWVLDLGADMTQFMNYTPLPGTALCKRLRKSGQLRAHAEFPYRHHTGAGELNWEHPHIKDGAAHFSILRDAFKAKYEEGGSAVLNMAMTALQGYISARDRLWQCQDEGMAWDAATGRYEKVDQPVADQFLELRIRKSQRIAMNMRGVILTNMVYGPNLRARKKAVKAMGLMVKAFGIPDVKTTATSLALLGMATMEFGRHLRARLKGQETTILQPPTIRRSYDGVQALARVRETMS